MTKRKIRPRSKGKILEVIPSECGPRELARILGVSRRAPKDWRDTGRGPAYREEDGRIFYDARSVTTWLYHDGHGQEILRRLRGRDD
jgi:hypothetical protein